MTIKKKRKPYKHQAKAIKFMQGVDRGGLFIDAGLGKTLISIRGTEIKRIKKKKKTKYIVVCPASLRINWKKEAELEGVEDRITIVSYEKLVQLVKGCNGEKDLIKHLFSQFDCMIVDESLRIKNLAAQRTLAVMAVSNYIKHCWFLTGTPTSKSSKDLFPTLSMCEPGKWGTYLSFLKEYTHEKFNAWSGELENTGYKNTESLQKKAASCCIRMKKAEVEKDLPKRIEVPFWVDVNLDDVSDENYEKALIEGDEEHIASAMKESAWLKMDSYLASLDDRGISHGILFCWHKEVARELADKMQGGLITGDVKDADRYREIENYMQGDTDWLVITIASGGEGLNIQRAGYIGFFQMPWTYDMAEQAISRAHRLGNENDRVLAEYVLLEGTIDVPQYKILMERKKESEKLTGDL